MLKTPYSNTETTKWRKPVMALACIVTLALSACSSSSDDVTTAADPQSPINIDNSDVDGTVDTGGTLDSGGSLDSGASLDPGATTDNAIDDGDPLSGGTSDGSAQFPSPEVDSGPEGLIVTGFDNTNSFATSPWLVHTSLFKNNSNLDVGEGVVDLVQYQNDFPVSAHVEFYTPILDTCEIDDPDAPPSSGGGEDDGSGPPPLISGGASVVINTPSGPWFTYNRSIEDGQSRYEASEGIPEELLPQGATLSVPGDVFPNVAAYPLYSAIPPVRLLPDANEPLTADSVYSWMPGIGKSFIEIDLQGFDAEDNFVDFVGSCEVVDDGSFTMPAEVTEFISNTRLRVQARYERVYERVDFENGIVFRQRSTVTE